MSGRNLRHGHHHQRGLQSALSDLSRPADAAPDLTRSIMGRLGYMRVSPAVARRRAIIRWLNRAGMLAVVGIALALGLRVFESSPQVRRPGETTVSQAVTQDMQKQQQRLGTALQTIRTISAPRLGRLPSPATAPEMYPVGYRTISNSDHQPISVRMGVPADDWEAPLPGGDVHQPHWPAPPVGLPAPGPAISPDGLQLDDGSPAGPQDLRDDVNRITIAPVRWA